MKLAISILRREAELAKHSIGTAPATHSRLTQSQHNEVYIDIYTDLNMAIEALLLIDEVNKVLK